MEAPQNPAGAFEPEERYGSQRRSEFIAVIETAPAALRKAISGLSEEQLNTRYRNWTIRVQLLRSMTEEQFARSFVHPETGKTVSLSAALCYYAWHSRHHTGQITWLREKHGWQRAP